MMRIWVGPEKEGKWKGTKTLFIEAQAITSAPVNRVVVIKSLIDVLEVEAIYFGAGRINLVGGGPAFEEVLDYCIQKGIKVTIEYNARPSAFDPLNCSQLYSKFKQLDIQFVERHDVSRLLPESLMKKLVYKIDTNHEAYFTNFEISDIVDIEEVCDGMYRADEVVYEEEEI